MKTIEFGEGSVIGEISLAVKLADNAGRYFNKVILTEAEYAEVRKELKLTVDTYHPTALPVFGGRSVFFMVQPDDATAEPYNPGLRAQEAQMRAQIDSMIAGAGGTSDDDDDDDELPGEHSLDDGGETKQ